MRREPANFNFCARIRPATHAQSTRKAWSLADQRGGDRTAESRAARPAGSCCVLQCRVPRPSTRSTAWMPTTRRRGNSSASRPSATRSVGSLKVGTSTASLRDVEVRVARRQALLSVEERRGHRQPDDLDPPAACVAGPVEPLARFREHAVVRVAPVALVADHHDAGFDEARKVVDVPGRVVAGDAASDPDHLIDAEVVAERALDSLLARARGCARSGRRADTPRWRATCPRRRRRSRRLRARRVRRRPRTLASAFQLGTSSSAGTPAPAASSRRWFG